MVSSVILPFSQSISVSSSSLQPYRAQALIVVEAMQSPSLKDKELQVHFGAASPIDLAKTLFPGGELTKIFQEVADLSGFGDDEDEDLEEIKN